MKANFFKSKEWRSELQGTYFMPTQKNICKYLVIKEETNILGDVFPQLTSPTYLTYLPTYLPTAPILPCTKTTTHYPHTHMLTCPPTYLNQPTISPPLA
jgi:hypothetical protein